MVQRFKTMLDCGIACMNSFYDLEENLVPFTPNDKSLRLVCLTCHLKRFDI